MKCKKCGKEIQDGQKFCPSCGSKVKEDSRFSIKLEAENKAQAHQQKMKDKEIQRQEKIIKEKGLKNPYATYSLICGLVGVVMALWPSGWETQMQWWYFTGVLAFGLLGYGFALKSNSDNKKIYQRYRVYVDLKKMKWGLYTSAFATFAGVILAMVYFTSQA